MKHTKQIISYLLFFAVVQAITIFSLYLFKKQELDFFISERQTEIKGQYSLLTSAYRRHIQMIYEKNFSTPEVLALMREVSVADTEERNRLRKELYNNFLPLYQHLLKNGFRQVHFHLADGTSFLRMHQPETFGDQLHGIRPSILLINSTKKMVEGYEMGRHWQAYRFVFPLGTVDHYLGSVEIGIPFSTLLGDFMANFPAEYRFIAKKEMAERLLDPADLRDHFSATAFSDAFLYETEDLKTIKEHGHPEKHNHTNQEVIDWIGRSLHNDLDKHLKAYKTVSLPLFQINKAFLVHLLPIFGIDGEAAGYLMAYEQNPTLLAMKWRYTIGYLLVTSFSLLLIGAHSLYATSLSNRLFLLQKLQNELNESHAKLDQIFNSAADGMQLIDLDGKVTLANNTFADLVHLPMNQVLGKKCYEVFSGPDCHTENCPLHLISNGAERIEKELIKARLDGTTSTCLVTAIPFYNSNGELTGMIEDFRDISERKQLEQQLQTLSTTDELTGLYNRRGFMALAQQQLHCVKRTGGDLFLLFADLDNMKWINDNLGHEAGDKALVLTAGLLRTVVRNADIVGRMGGDEFAVLFTSTSNGDMESILLARLEQNLAEINKGLSPEQQIAISFGVAHHDSGDVSLEEFLVQADSKMYAEKKRKKAAVAKAKEAGVTG